MEQLTAGRELDALVAEKVMELTLDYEFADYLGAPTCRELREPLDEWGILPGYSTDIAAAWAVVEKMAENDISLHLAEVIPSSDAIVWEVMFSGRDISDTYTCEMSVPFAVCLAALKAVGVDYGTSRTEENS